MKTNQASAFFAVILATLVPAVSQERMAVDAAGPIRERARIASIVRGGGVGRLLSLKVAIETNVISPDTNGKTLVEFILTNSGRSNLTLPISPHPGDLEPSDPKATYTVMTLGLRIGLSRKPGAVFPGGAELFGNADHPGTIVTLAPDESIRVLARVALPGEGSAEPFDAGASVNNEIIKDVNGELVSDSQEIGFARSKQYTVRQLLRSPN
jgi:hypothetical protein